MALFENMSTEGHEEQTDRLGGYRAYDSDAYDAVIKLAYASKSPKGARAVNFEFDLGDNRTFKQTIYVTNQEGENFWLSKDGKNTKNTLPGWITVDNICLVTTEKPLSQQADEEKTVNVYDPELKRDAPKSVPVLVDLIGKPVTLGIVKQTVDQTEKDGNGGYRSTGKTKDENEINAVFHAESKMTVVEARKGLDPDFFNKWVEANKGNTRDKTSKAKGGNGAAGAPQAGAAGGARKSLFGG